jgi:2-keto-3-deoxy-L-rhamnonate aldolase RhmA
MNAELKRKLYDNEVCFGTWISSSSPNTLDLLRRLKFDWFVLDSEHSPINAETLNSMIQILGDSSSPMVRVGLNDQYLIKLALDAGAAGVVVPLVNTKEEATRAVSYSLYPPLGVRGAAATRASNYGLDFGRYVRRANEEVIIAIQVETRDALANIDEILNVKGIDIAFVGPSDMTVSLGLVDDRTNPKVIEAMRSVVAACERHGKIPGVMAITPEEAKNAVKLGFRFVSLASDMKFLAAGAKAFLSAAGRE